MPSTANYPVPPLKYTDTREWLRRIAQSVIGIMDGKINAVGTVTLTANAASTTLTDKRLGAESTVVLMPQTANAAAAIATTYIATQAAESATITHANNAQADKTFRYAILG